MNEKIPTLADPLEPEQIEAYLREHLDFFEQHHDLLAEITLPHESGVAVSLVERQVSILRERNIDMRNRLSKLLDNARDNDKLFDKSKRLVLSLIEGQDTEEFRQQDRVHFLAGGGGDRFGKGGRAHQAGRKACREGKAGEFHHHW